MPLSVETITPEGNLTSPLSNKRMLRYEVSVSSNSGTFDTGLGGSIVAWAVLPRGSDSPLVPPVGALSASLIDGVLTVATTEATSEIDLLVWADH